MEHQQAQLTLPGVVPQEAQDFRSAVRAFYKNPAVTRDMQNADFASYLHLSARTWLRRKKLLREGRLGGRDWIETWPITREWTPSWESLLQESLEAQAAEHKSMAITYRETFDEDGRLIDKKLLSVERNTNNTNTTSTTNTANNALGHLSALAAVLFGYTLLDLSNGHLSSMRLDGPLQMHSILLEIMAQCGRWLA